MSSVPPSPSTPAPLDAASLRRALCLRDLTDPAHGPHALQLLLEALLAALREAWGCAVEVHRAPPLVSLHDNYDALGYPPDGAARDARYTRYVNADTVLRTQMSAEVPALLRARAPLPTPADVLLACPGLVYRRDTIDRLHVGEPHQLDLWRLRVGPPLGAEDLRRMVASVMEAALPGRQWRTTPAVHPYTEEGLQVDVRVGDAWVEAGECGLASPRVLARCGVDTARVSGLAMGLGMDRLLMLRKGLDDIRLLRSADPRIARQLLDLAPWRPVSHQPAARRDLSVAVEADATPEELGDRVRAALGARAASVEEVAVLSETPGEALPPAAVARIGLLPGQKNVLLRVVLRDLDRSLTTEEANALRDDIYAALHRGTAHQWAAGPREVGRRP
jgi:phenylalanyl-tRNA synthetase alpha chain